MNDNLYSIDSWTPSTFYYKNKILINNNQYYYAMNDYTSSSDIQTDINNGNLGGYIYDRGQNIPLFLWKPSFDFTNKNIPRIKKIQFGDGYYQSLPDGTNNLLLNYNFVFETRDLHETTAILHFLTQRNGVESFAFVCPAPRGQLLRFKCSEWSDTQKFYSNYSITANFIQTPV